MTPMDLVNMASGGVLVLAAWWVGQHRPWVTVFVAATGVAWATGSAVASFEGALGDGVADGGRAFAAVALLLASLALVVTARSYAGGRVTWIAAVGLATAAALFLGRDTVYGLDAATGGRLARDIGLAAYVFALMLFAAQARPGGGRPMATVSMALLVYPGIVAGIYLHPLSHRNMIALAAALLVVSGLWIRNTMTPDAIASRRAMFVALFALALPLLALATVRVHGGLDAAAEGPLRALARTVGPLWFAFALPTGPRATLPAAQRAPWSQGGG